jgi:hypothetical protein
MGEMINAYKIIVGKSIGRPRRERLDNIRRDLTRI